MMHRIRSNDILHRPHARERRLGGFVERSGSEDPDVAVGEFDGGGTASYGHDAEAGEGAAFAKRRAGGEGR